MVVGSQTVTNGWWERFLQQHPNLTLKSAVSLSVHRARATDLDVFRRYYDMLEECLRCNDILDKPSVIFNCDETVLAFNPPCFKVIDEKGSKSLCNVTSGDKSKATVLAFVNAVGIAYPPMVIFGLKTYNTLLSKGEVPGTTYALSENSWINSEVFRHWFEEHFLKLIPSTRPILLLLDGHSSHYSPATIQLAAENQIILFTLPPHTTHVSQPLDRCCFSPLKAAWRQVCHEFYTANPGRCVTKYDFSSLLHKAWNAAMTSPNIVSGFNATGVCPFNRDAIVIPDAEDKYTKFKRESLAERTGLSYIPVYSPSLSRTKSVHKTPASDEQLLSSSAVVDSKTPKVSGHSSTISTQSTEEEPPVSLSHGYSEPLSHTIVNKFLPKLTPCHTLPTKNPKSAGTILTDWEYRKAQEEKEKLKQEKLAEKERRKLERQQQAALKKAQATKKAQAKKQGTCPTCSSCIYMQMPIHNIVCLEPVPTISGKKSRLGISSDSDSDDEYDGMCRCAVCDGC